MCIACCTMFFGFCGSVHAQQKDKVFRIGFLDPSNASGSAVVVDVFRQELSKLGWIEGKNITIESRYANESYTRLAEIAAELVRLKVDLIVVRDSIAIRPAMRASNIIPIVMLVSGDPVADGRIDSLARPGGNLTGLTNISPQLSGKRLELLKEVVPGASRVAVLGPGADSKLTQFQSAAQQLGVRLQAQQIQKADQLIGAFEAAITCLKRIGGLCKLQISDY